jgi:FecR-like protein
MPLPRNCTATKAGLLLALLFVCTVADAEPVGTVTELSGSLLVKGVNGVIKVLALNSPLEQGDILISRREAYATVSLADHSSVTLGPDTELTVEKYSFDAARPQNNAAVLNLARGRVRIAAGLLGKRSTDTFNLTTPSATIDIRGSTFIAGYVTPGPTEIAGSGEERMAQPESARVAIGYTAAAAYKYVRMRSFTSQAPLLLAANSSVPLQIAQNVPSPGSGGLSPGLYVQVLDGAIHLTNGGGTQNFTAGQFGFTPGFQQPPVILPTNPGMQFTPPPSFTSTTGSAGGTGAAKPGDVDCQVR